MVIQYCRIRREKIKEKKREKEMLFHSDEKQED